MAGLQLQNHYGITRDLPVMAGVGLLLLLILQIPASTAGYFPRTESWAWSELHINYAGGFIRRGLLGEIAYQLKMTFGLATTTFFGSVFLVVMLLNAGLLFRLLRPVWFRPFIFWTILLAPSLLLFPVYSHGALLRKDLFISLGILAHALLVQMVRHALLTPARYIRLLFIFIAPYITICIFIHELQWFFLPVHAMLVKMVSGLGLNRQRIAMASLVPALLLGPFILMSGGDSQVVDAICNSWKGQTRVNCADFSGIGAIGWTLNYTMELAQGVLASSDPMRLYALAALSAVPALVLLILLWCELKPLKVISGTLVVLIPTLPLFFIAHDWGRYLHLQMMSAVAILLALAPVKFTRPAQRPKLLTALLIPAVSLYLVAWHLPHAAIGKSGMSGKFSTTLWRVADLLRSLEFLAY